MRSRYFYFAAVLLLVFSVEAVSQKKPIQFKPYGFFKLDMAFDQARTNNGNYIFWVNNVPDGADKDNEFNMTARQTRLGVNFLTQEYEGKTVTARVEFDFYGGGAENKNFLMLRHCYLKVDFEKFYILAGQTSDVISPLVPTTVLYTVLWNAGNVGYRRPQFQIGNRIKEGVSVVGALSRNIAGDLDGDGTDDGEDNPFPTLQTRISYLIPGKLNVGLSAHYGKMQYTVGSENKDYNSYSIGGHIQVNVNDDVTLKGEVFTGKTMAQYLGGIGQGYNTALGKEIETVGGWACLSVKADEKTQLNAGFGIDKPKEETLSVGNRDYNLGIFGNVFANIAYNTRLGLEVSHWTTGYYNGSDSDRTSSLRLQASFIFSF